ncbi:AFG1-like ATPase-domain-containing protein [Mycena filopes]|nr:AFG1-like ATPase-domain-containing protein [Mycena filopes]
MKYWRSLVAARRLSLRPGPFASYSPRRRLLSSHAAVAESSPRPAAPPPGLRTAGEDLNEPLPQYRKLVRGGTLRGDDHQTRIIQKLQDLHNTLVNYDPPRIPPPAAPSLFSRLLGKPAEPFGPPPDVPKGLYLYGDVGTGKTMLMDLFYSTLPRRIRRKRRVHFHAFMIDVHKRIHAVKASAGHVGDPILPVARDLANEASVLCFDEFQVTDIADAMILRRLLESLLNFGVVCVMTSNRHPDDLYKNGIQRSSFIPTIELLKTQFEVTDLDSGTDYRRIARAASSVQPYHYPLSPQTTKTIDSIFDSLTDSREDPVFSFQELCGNPLSAADYLEITRVFGTVFLMDVWKMGVDRKDLARRFITFIDARYLHLPYLPRPAPHHDSKTRLFITSEVPIYQVFSDDTGKTEGTSDHMRGVMDDLVCLCIPPTPSASLYSFIHHAFRASPTTSSGRARYSRAKRRYLRLRGRARGLCRWRARSGRRRRGWVRWVRNLINDSWI